MFFDLPFYPQNTQCPLLFVEVYTPESILSLYNLRNILILLSVRTDKSKLEPEYFEKI